MKTLGRFAVAALAAAFVILLPGRPAVAAVVTIAPSRDNTLFEDNGNRSCAVGPLFGGETAYFGSRRILIGFDVAGHLPRGSTVTSVDFGITVEGTGPAAQASDVYSLHRLQADWGETSSACVNGVGGLAEPGDATWSHRHFATDAWSVAGGDFDATPSGSVAMPTLGLATWISEPGMLADVQSWLDTPAGNFGWILIGAEAAPATAREFYSRESATPPSLRIVFTSPPATPPAVPDGQAGSPVLLSKLSADGADLGVAWDGTLCSGNLDHHIVFGTGSGLPATIGGPYALEGSVCHLGASSPFVWSGSPDPAVLDPSTGLLFLLVLADDGGTTEGSWGRASLLQERSGPGPNGCSNQCGILDKSLINTCGNGF